MRLCGMIRRCESHDRDQILGIINDGASAYRGVIPHDCYTEPYMTREELDAAVGSGIEFFGFFDEAGLMTGVMGIQLVEDVTLIRHAYVSTANQRRGIGAHLLNHLRPLATGPILIGTWADASWAIRFYERNGFEVVGSGEKVRLLKRYWTVPARQIETSVVLADSKWKGSSEKPE